MRSIGHESRRITRPPIDDADIELMGGDLSDGIDNLSYGVSVAVTAV